MKTAIPLPEELNLDRKETARFLAAKMYEAGRLTLGQAAKLAGLSKVTFAEILADYNVSLFNYPPEDILNEETQL